MIYSAIIAQHEFLCGKLIIRHYHKNSHDHKFMYKLFWAISVF